MAINKSLTEQMRAYLDQFNTTKESVAKQKKITEGMTYSQSQQLPTTDKSDFRHMMNLSEGANMELDSIKNRCPQLYAKIVGMD